MCSVSLNIYFIFQNWNRFMLHQMHVELVETKKKAEERRLNRKPFVFKEIDFPNILGEKVRDKKNGTGN